MEDEIEIRVVIKLTDDARRAFAEVHAAENPEQIEKVVRERVCAFIDEVKDEADDHEPEVDVDD